MQNYKNHARYYPFHHFFLTPLTLVYFIWTCINLFHAILGGTDILTQIYHLVGAIILVALPLLARIYALNNQNRIIRMEMRLRYFELAGKSFKEKESKLRLSQVIALRFAGDEELLPLMDKAIKENMKSKEIKMAITNWQEDNNRV